MADRDNRGGPADRFSDNQGNASNEKVSNLMMVNGSNMALHHNAHFSDKEDSVGPYEGSAGAAHGSSGKKKSMPVAAVPQVTKPTSMEDFETISKLGTYSIFHQFNARRRGVQFGIPSEAYRGRRRICFEKSEVASPLRQGEGERD